MLHPDDRLQDTQRFHLAEIRNVQGIEDPVGLEQLTPDVLVERQLAELGGLSYP